MPQQPEARHHPSVSERVSHTYVISGTIGLEPDRLAMSITAIPMDCWLSWLILDQIVDEFGVTFERVIFDSKWRNL